MSKAIADAPVNRAWVIALAMVIATHETPLGKSLWHDHPATTPAYLYLLACAGAGAGGDYTLDEVEQAAAGDIDDHGIDIGTAARPPHTGAADAVRGCYQRPRRPPSNTMNSGSSDRGASRNRSVPGLRSAAVVSPPARSVR
ncbi:hypothetical protein [Nocardia cyriacigeorgica]|uniref:hypothetical protein n=1 Tax=Nocardia cyriacigeorgica TaxID=135487 RepID=UPI00189465F6|nr:hypothetical protein [Nocardia cyriacigeorgica]MBF6454988.1 hypothetical protein [Nocardia cyriacigeorgica]MBF6480437.1 hypothetical protein [Nocardia cyriacigeorgica]MBF6552883.1 hypothetical protein [Nocardia cyriacigeorgica]